MLGDSCVDLGQGFPNFDPPEFVVQAVAGVRGWAGWLGGRAGVPVVQPFPGKWDKGGSLGMFWLAPLQGQVGHPPFETSKVSCLPSTQSRP